MGERSETGGLRMLTRGPGEEAASVASEDTELVVWRPEVTCRPASLSTEMLTTEDDELSRGYVTIFSSRVVTIFPSHPVTSSPPWL